MAKRGRKKSELSLLERLLDKVIINDITDCWEYQGGKNNVGYGMIRDEKKMRTTHRVSYEEHNQVSIPNGLCVMHKCDNPACVNPNHLSIGTRKDNNQDMINKGRDRPFGLERGMGPMLGRKQPKTLCVHCNKEIPNNTYGRYHGNNCKYHPKNV